MSVASTESLSPAVGRMLGTNGLQASADKLDSAADKIANAVSQFSQIASTMGSNGGGGMQGASGNGGGARAATGNGGGSTFSNTGRFGGSNGSGAVGAAIAGLSAYGKNHQSDMVTMDYTTNYLAQGTGQGISSQTGLYQNQRWAQSPGDLSSALLTTQQALGVGSNTSQFKTAIGGLATMATFDPTLSGSQAAQIAQGTSGWANYYRLRAYGIQTTSANGGTMTAPQQTAALQARMVPGGVSSMAQVNATFGDKSNAAYNLKNMGYDSTTASYMLTQMRANAIGSLAGKTPDQMSALAQQFQTGSKSASKSAQAQLTQMGFTNTDLQSMKTANAALTSRDADVLPGFSSGMQAAAGALTDFRTAVTNAAGSLGLLNPLGKASGALSGLGGSVAGGATLGLAARAMMGGGGAGGGAGGGIRGMLGGGMDSGAMGAMAGRLGIAGAAVGAGLLAGHYAQKYIGGGQAGARGAAGSITGNALRGAGIGAGIGTLIEPGIGTAIGGGIGAVAGGVYGWFSRPKHSTGDGQTGGATSGAAAGAGSSGTKATGTMGAGKTGAAAVAVAMKYLGTPYKYGGSTPETGFDCSGLVQWSFKQIGVQLPRVAADQGNSGSAIDRISVVIGDLIFKALPGKGAHHVAMIAGGGNLIEAAHTGTNIRLRKYDPTEWQFARRVIGAAGSMAVTDGTTAASGGLLASMSYGGDMGDTSVNDAGEASNIAGALSGINGMSSGTSGGMSSTGNGSAATATTNGSTTAGTAGAAMTNSGLKGILQAAGFSGTGLATAYAVAMAESGGKAGAHNPNVKTGDNSYGLFQINMLGQMGANRLKQFGLTSDDQLYDPMTNAKAAYAISSGGKNWGAWTTYKDGAYKQYLNSYAKGTINVAYDQVAQLHAGETVLNKRDAQTVRDALMANNRPSAGSGSSGATVTVGDIYVTVQGVMDTKAASDAANQISKVIKSNLRTENIMSGNI